MARGLDLIVPLPPSSHAKPIDAFPEAADLAQALTREVRGEVRFDRGSRALYATDGSNYRQIPIGLVVPRDADDVVAAVAVCRKYGAPVLPRGAGTSLAGQCCNVAVVFDFTKYMNRILEIDPIGRRARVQPGVVLDSLRNAAEAHGLTFGPDPSTHSRCTLGGMIGNNSCGTHSLLAGKTVDNVDELHILLYDGTRLTVGVGTIELIAGEKDRAGEISSRLTALRDQYGARIRERFPRIPRRVSGYNLDELLAENDFHVARALVGTEGTCAIVLEATVKLIHSPRYRALVGLGYADTFAAADHVPEILEFHPIGLEGFEGSMVDGLRKKGAPHLDLVPAGRGYLLVEFGSDTADDVDEAATRFVSWISQIRDGPSVRRYNPNEARAMWRIREAGPRAAATAPGAPLEWEGWDDASVAPEKLGAYLRELRALVDQYQYRTGFYGHFGHGCIHMRVNFDLETEKGIRKYAEFIDRAADLVIRYGGSLSGEHGDGQSRGALLPKMFGDELVAAFREFKAIWDPHDKLNPHKVVDAYLPTENLRLGADYAPRKPRTHFAFADDSGSLERASLRCVGLGECRKHDSGSMCPSYMVTLEEQHSTRGRAHMLFELLQGEVVGDGWHDEDVKRSLDLCLSCKACKSECPANVDMATYRAEFLAHYYEGQRRPVQAYAFGLLNEWLRLGAAAPSIANALIDAPAVGSLLKRMLHIAPARQLPRLSRVTFRQWAGERERRTVGRAQKTASGEGDRSEVILWVDTFNNHFHPETTRAALEVLESAGYLVTIPRANLCCGRPLYDFGLLDRAKRYLQTILVELRAPIDAGTPIVVLEPSCASVFRDELRNLFPNDARALALSRQTVLLSELLESGPLRYEPPRMSGRLLLHGHCHQKALMKMSHAEAVLRKMGLTVEAPDSGCCGMAGAFGFEADKYAVSQAIGERVLLPAVRATSLDTLIVTDGFSCREQIRQATGRPAVHLAEVLKMASNH
ncbi:MAG TPA: FAD-binding and (Fe-S)-binding domain-containing protein [Vicinamibacterales bacterium]|nr:FAD-binding and (Fe-S)-binding domain-containing protein [Vicinamibacterales bacterium]